MLAQVLDETRRGISRTSELEAIRLTIHENIALRLGPQEHSKTLLVEGIHTIITNKVRGDYDGVAVSLVLVGATVLAVSSLNEFFRRKASLLRFRFRHRDQKRNS